MKNIFSTLFAITAVIFLIVFSTINYYIDTSNPSFSCGDGKYYKFRDLEGFEIVTNLENSEFRYNFLPYTLNQRVDKEYPYRINSQYFSYIGKESNTQKQVDNLKLCYPANSVIKVETKN